MKNKKLFYYFSTIFSFVVLGVFITFLGSGKQLFSQQSKILEGSVDRDIDSLQSILLDNFEEEAWTVKTVPGLPISAHQTKIVPGSPDALVYINSTNSLGLKFKFVYPSVHNKVEITPPNSKRVPRLEGEFDENGQQKLTYVNGIAVPGIAKKVGIWALSRGCECTLYIQFQDWKGIQHNLKMGSLKYLGWKPLIIDIPTNIPQAVDSLPQRKGLIITKFFIRMNRDLSAVKDEYIFLDALRVFSEVSNSQFYFDGSDLYFDSADKNAVQKDKNQIINTLRSSLEGIDTSSAVEPTTTTEGN